MKRSLVALAALGLLYGGTASAAPITYGVTNPADPLATESAFLNSLGATYGTETFAGFATGPVTTPLALDFGVVGGRISACDLESVAMGCSIRDMQNLGRKAVSGDEYLLANNAAGFTISFDAPINGFSFFATDIGDFGGQLQLVAYLNGVALAPFSFVIGTAHDPATALPFNPPMPGMNEFSGAVDFFGFYDPTLFFDELRFENTDLRDTFSYDNFTAIVAPNTVPEPASLLLFGTGIAALARRRVRNKNR